MAVKIVKQVGETLVVYATIINHGVGQTMYTSAHLFKPDTTYAIGLAPSVDADNPVTLATGESIDVIFIGDIPSEVGPPVEAGLYDVIIQLWQVGGGFEPEEEKVLPGEVEIRVPDYDNEITGLRIVPQAANIGETAHFYPKIRNNGVAQRAVINIRVGDWWSLGGTFDMAAGSETEYEVSGIVGAVLGVHDVAVTVYDIKGQVVVTEQVFPDAFEVLGEPGYVSLGTGVIGNGTIIPPPGEIHYYLAGDYAALSATPFAGWEFNHFLINGAQKIYQNPYNLLMDGDKSAIAVFRQIPAETIQQQLASCWTYICGAGACGGVCDEAPYRWIWVNRDSLLLSYDACRGTDDIGGKLQSGDRVNLWVIQDCTLSYKGWMWHLTTGAMNEINW